MVGQVFFVCHVPLSVIIMDRVRAQQAEHGHVDLLLGRLGRGEHAAPGGIVGLVEITAYKCVGIRVGLVPADGEGLDRIVVRQIVHGIAVQQPAGNGLRIFSDYCPEVFHGNVDQLLSFLHGVGHGEARYHMPVPGPAFPPSPGYAGLLGQGLHDLIP